jgi:hypothetical protein
MGEVKIKIPVLIRLPETKDDVGILSHDRERGVIHEFEATGIVGFVETVSIGESVEGDEREVDRRGHGGGDLWKECPSMRRRM